VFPAIPDARKPSAHVGMPRACFAAGQDLNLRPSGYETVRAIKLSMAYLIESCPYRGFRLRVVSHRFALFRVISRTKCRPGSRTAQAESGCAKGGHVALGIGSSDPIHADRQSPNRCMASLPRGWSVNPPYTRTGRAGGDSQIGRRTTLVLGKWSLLYRIGEVRHHR
jgi:hypothetical protein